MSCIITNAFISEVVKIRCVDRITAIKIILKELENELSLERKE